MRLKKPVNRRAKNRKYIIIEDIRYKIKETRTAEYYKQAGLMLFAEYFKEKNITEYIATDFHGDEYCILCEDDGKRETFMKPIRRN